MSKKWLAILLVAVSLCSLYFFTLPVSGVSDLSAAAPVSITTPQHISIDASANGTTVHLLEGDRLIVNLRYFAGAPFVWELDPIDTSVLENVGHERVPDQPVVPGSAGTDIWTFEGVGVGFSPVTLNNINFSNGTTAETFSVTVNVGPTPVPATSNLATGILVAGLSGGIAWFTLRKVRRAQTG
jgi:inhibitor of cysteine peptidase